MRSSCLLFTFLIATYCSYAQLSHREAAPAIGWDSLKALIVYPEIAKRAGVRGYVNVSLELDTIGRIVNSNVCGFPLLERRVRQVIESVQWLPEVAHDGSRRTSYVVFDVQFKLKDLAMPQRSTLVIESERHQFRSVH